MTKKSHLIYNVNLSTVALKLIKLCLFAFYFMILIDYHIITTKLIFFYVIIFPWMINCERLKKALSVGSYDVEQIV